MICQTCDKRFEFTQGRFVEANKIPGYTGKVYNWYCRDCLLPKKIAIDDRVETRPEHEQIPVEAYDD